MKEKIKRLIVLIILLIIIGLGLMYTLKEENKKKEERIISKTISNITYKLLNEDKPDYKLKKINLSKETIDIKGKKKDVDRVKEIIALIDLDNKLFNEVGTYTIDDFNIIAYDINNKKVKDIEFPDNNISASIEMDYFTNEVPIRVTYADIIANNLAVESFTVEGEYINSYKIKIKGKRKITVLSYADYTINIKGDSYREGDIIETKADVENREEIDYPKDLKLNFKLKLGKATSKMVRFKEISYEGLDSNLEVEASSEEGYIDAQLIGIQELIDKIDPDNPQDIQAYIDLKGYAEGEYEVPIKVKSNDQRIQGFINKSVKVKLYTT